MLLLIALLSLLPIRSKGDPLSNRTLPVKDTNCAAPWMDGSAVGLGCLLFESDIALTWYNASAFCQDQKSAKLIAIESAEQKEFVIMVIGLVILIYMILCKPEKDERLVLNVFKSPNKNHNSLVPSVVLNSTNNSYLSPKSSSSHLDRSHKD